MRRLATVLALLAVLWFAAAQPASACGRHRRCCNCCWNTCCSTCCSSCNSCGSNLRNVRVNLRIVRGLWLQHRMQRLRGRHNGPEPDNGSVGSGGACAGDGASSREIATASAEQEAANRASAQPAAAGAVVRDGGFRREQLQNLARAEHWERLCEETRPGGIIFGQRWPARSRWPGSLGSHSISPSPHVEPAAIWQRARRNRAFLTWILRFLACRRGASGLG